MTRLRQIMLDELQRRTVDDADNMAADFVRQLKIEGSQCNRCVIHDRRHR